MIELELPYFSRQKSYNTNLTATKLTYDRLDVYCIILLPKRLPFKEKTWFHLGIQLFINLLKGFQTSIHLSLKTLFCPYLTRIHLPGQKWPKFFANSQSILDRYLKNRKNNRSTLLRQKKRLESLTSQTIIFHLRSELMRRNSGKYF